MSHCHVVTDACTAPAGYRTGAGSFTAAPSVRLPTCYTCGLPVCAACSAKVGRSRICLTCQHSNVRAARLCDG